MNNIKEQILNDSKNIITKDRNKQYGEPEDSFKIIADLWSIYLDKEITSKDVGLMMVLFKIARNKYKSKYDNYLDMIGYAACTAEIDNDNIKEDNKEVENKYLYNEKHIVYDQY